MMIVGYAKAIASEVDLLLYLSNSVAQVRRCLHELTDGQPEGNNNHSQPAHT